MLVLYDGTPRLENHHLVDLAAGNITFKDLVNDGIVEWVDAEEEEDLYIAPRPFVLPETVPEGKFSGRPVTHEKIRWANLGEPGESHAIIEAEVRMPNGKIEVAKLEVPLLFGAEHTHVEIDPQLVLGVCASLIPYPEHNSTPRVTGGTAMVKQSLGLPSANYRCAQTHVLTSCTTLTVQSSVPTL